MTGMLLMAGQYIVAIVGVSLFAVLCLCYLIFYIKTKRKEADKMQNVIDMYSNPDYRKADYDCMPYDKETQRILSERQSRDGQLTIDDVIKPAVQAKEEEITGNYKHD